MKILYCRIGWSELYCGERPVNGGSYNKDHIGLEAYTFRKFSEQYYGFVETGGQIHIEKIKEADIDRAADTIEDVLVVWIATKPRPQSGQFIVGWYKNAKVYRRAEKLTDTLIAMIPTLKEENEKEYNIISSDALMLKESERTFEFIDYKPGQCNVWYGNEKINAKVKEYIESYESIEKGSNDLKGETRKAIINARVNQGIFREQLIEKYGKCCLCNVKTKDLLIASHIKPWSMSDGHEKIDANNGLLLCPNHDKLFDLGFISFDENGEILISDELNEKNLVSEDMKIPVNKDNSKYLEYHRNNIFKKKK